MLTYFAPEEAGFDPARLQRAYDHLGQAAATGAIPGAALLVARQGKAVAPYSCGQRQFTPDSAPTDADTTFLVASVTKPVTAAAVLLLVERGQLQVSDRVADILPEFGKRGKEAVRVYHLLTHTSGLPDMLPQDRELRRRHAPLSEFTAGTCELELQFAPGTRISYQSMGTNLLGAIVERLTGQSLPEFLRQEFFIPLRMLDTGLGAQGLDAERIAHVHLPADMEGQDWGWNQPYWQQLGAPWGGLFTTVSDYFRFCQLFLNGGDYGGTRILSPATVRAMTSDQTTHLVRMAAGDDRSGMIWGQSWGFGWTLIGKRIPDGGRAFFGDLSSPATYGHGGATGTAVWIDPASGVVCVLFTTEPQALTNGLIGRCSNLVAAAAVS